MAATMTFPAHWPDWTREFPAELQLPDRHASPSQPVGHRYPLTNPFQYDLVWAFQELQFPCNCCSATLATEEGVWTCQTTHREWAILGADEQNWGAVNEAEFAAMRAAETSLQRIVREAAEAKAEHDRELDGEASKMSSYAQHVGVLSTRKVQGQFIQRKVQKACKWLYLNEAAPRSQWRKNEKGEWCAPMVRKLTGSQCWAWEYVHPKTKQKMAPHKCDHLHPGEAGWRVEWNTDRAYNPQDPFTQLGAARGVAPSAPSAKPKTAPSPTNQWAALDNTAW